MLPSEILLRIFEYAHDHKQRPRWIQDKTEPMPLLAISLVCWEWKNLAESLLYRNIALDYPPYREMEDLFESLRSNLRSCPGRTKFVQKLHLDYSNRDVSDCVEDDDEILGYLHQMTNLKSLSLNCHYRSQLNHDIMEQISAMAIERLTLRCRWTNLMLEKYLATGFADKFQALKVLRIGGADLVLIPEKRLPAIHFYTSKIEAITILSDCHPGTLCELFLLPRSLRKVEVNTLFDRCEWGDLYTTTSIQRFLDFQSQSLEYIALPGHPYGDDMLPDFSYYVSLTYLELSWCNIFRSHPNAAAKRLSSPLLKTLSINMNGEDQCRERYEEFQENHANWVLEYAKNYRNLLPKGALQIIHIEYRWTDEFPYVYDKFEDPWPNACMKTLKPAVAQLGFELTWPQPAMSEEEWLSSTREEECQRVSEAHNSFVSSINS